MSITSPIVNFLGHVLIITNSVLYNHSKTSTTCVGSNLNQFKIPLYFQVSLINNLIFDCNYEKSEQSFILSCNVLNKCPGPICLTTDRTGPC